MDGLKVVKNIVILCFNVFFWNWKLLVYVIELLDNIMVFFCLGLNNLCSFLVKLGKILIV